MTAPHFQVTEIKIDEIFVVGSRRPLDRGAVDRLVQSIEKIGLQTPITVRSGNVIDPETGEDLEAFVLVAGHHRLEAAKALGWTRIPAIWRECDEIDAQLWEIAENLHRAELTALERDEQVAKWVELNTQKLAQVEPVSGGRGNVGGVRAAARELGLEKEDARRAVKVASLSSEAKEAAREAGLDDNRTALLEAARKTTVAEQVAAIQERAEAKAKPVKLADEPLNDFEAKEKQIAALMNAWNKASSEAREEFLSRIDTPIMDKRFG